MLIDSHCHLDFPALAKDQQGVVERARAAGVGRFLTISTHITKARQVIGVAESYPDVFCTIGVHPHHVAEDGEQVTAADLAAKADHPKIAALGETGLDYFYDTAPRQRQQESFREHMRACIATGLPMIVHSRDAEEDTASLIAEERRGKEDKLHGVMHCFSSKRILAEAALAMGFYISFSGILTFKKSEELRAIARDVPLDRLLVETDAPFLAPEPYRGKQNEPAFIVHTAAVLAQVKGVTTDQIAAITTENFYRLFTKVN
ncbi:MAG: TatD family hydrolase [Alphaproteobacteria bacterium]